MYHERATRKPEATRDLRETSFTAILVWLVDRVPGARAVALVDAEGETVDYAGGLDAFAARVAAAHWRIVLEDARRETTVGLVRSLTVHATSATFVIHGLPHGYAIVLVLVRRGGCVSQRALVACGQLLSAEAGWGPLASSWPRWFPVQMLTDEAGRPDAIEVPHRTPEPIAIIGHCTEGLGRGERSWRIRTAAGIEATLVREPGALWYVDEPVDAQTSFWLSARQPPKTR